MSDTLTIYRVSVGDEEFAELGWRFEHFASETEADLAAAVFEGEGLTVLRHALDVPTSPAALSLWLNTYAGRSGRVR